MLGREEPSDAGGLGGAGVLTAADPAALQALVEGRYGDPFGLLGPHIVPEGAEIRALLPGALSVTAVSRVDGSLLCPLRPLGASGLFVGRLHALQPYLLRIEWPGAVQETEDPYAFDLLLSELDLHLIGEGRHLDLGRCLGAQRMSVDGVPGVRFAVWAPNALRVSVIGDFNSWDGRRHLMRKRVPQGVWEIFVPRVGEGVLYKYEIVGPQGQSLPPKADPVALATEMPPATASVVASNAPFDWSDDDWMAARRRADPVTQPMSVYEVHVASWLRVLEEDGRSLNWEELAERLIPYALGMGFTHIELLPVMEHPFGGSWGYQPLGQFAPTARMGSPKGFARFVDRCHAEGLGVILDWVPAHFPNDAHGLAQFDGTALYEHQDPREGYHPDWHSMIYNFGRNEVSGFLVASALHWLEHYHVDGLRVDAVASMLYRDYSRKHGEWVPNIYGGRENLEAIAFLQRLNTVVRERCPGALMIAEESTAWPGVTAPVEQGGLGFHFKWNMGWMHDSLRYAGQDPLYRRYHHDQMTFGLVYAFAERFVLPLSHDEVVHGKGSILGRMPGGGAERLANLRAYYGWMWTHPGKKLLFMGQEFGQPTEWNHNTSPEWHCLDQPAHRGIQRLVRDLNGLYRSEPALHESDATPAGFQWVVGDDRENCVFAFLRHAAGHAAPLMVVCNFTPVARHGYRVGVPRGGWWREVFNTDSVAYGGSDIGNGGGVAASPEPAHGMAHSLVLTLPPLSMIAFKP
jgi:1,4-alpha-glucan branching enzyme